MCVCETYVFEEFDFSIVLLSARGRGWKSSGLPRIYGVRPRNHHHRYLQGQIEPHIIGRKLRTEWGWSVRRVGRRTHVAILCRRCHVPTLVPLSRKPTAYKKCSLNDITKTWSHSRQPNILYFVLLYRRNNNKYVLSHQYVYEFTGSTYHVRSVCTVYIIYDVTITNWLILI